MIKINFMIKSRLYFTFHIYYTKESCGNLINNYIAVVFHNNILIKVLYD